MSRITGISASRKNAVQAAQSGSGARSGFPSIGLVVMALDEWLSVYRWQAASLERTVKVAAQARNNERPPTVRCINLHAVLPIDGDFPRW